MKIRELINDLEKYKDSEVILQGWIRNSRFGKNVDLSN